MRLHDKYYIGNEMECVRNSIIGGACSVVRQRGALPRCEKVKSGGMKTSFGAIIEDDIGSDEMRSRSLSDHQDKT